MKLALTLSVALLAGSSWAMAHEGHEQDDAAKQKETYALMAAAQQICPVTGMELDSMGGPIKAKSGEKTIFLCCKSCVGKPIKPEAWKQIQKNLADAQGICPILKKPLPENAASTVVEGRTVFVCCKSCIEKVKADPEKTFAVIDAQIKKHVENEKSADKN
ncbi:MAG: hypothetical protein H0T47_03235 [Planctomycetaceae bacterium]|nr:hypothetical protein [Planctomycetaceae bacterium]